MLLGTCSDWASMFYQGTYFQEAFENDIAASARHHVFCSQYANSEMSGSYVF